MSESTELLGQAFRRVGNPFVVCEIVSQRARQLLSASSQLSAREAITRALQELASGCLDFQMPGGQEPAGMSEAVRPVGHVEQPLAALKVQVGVEASAR